MNLPDHLALYGVEARLEGRSSEAIIASLRFALEYERGDNKISPANFAENTRWFDDQLKIPSFNQSETARKYLNPKPQGGS